MTLNNPEVLEALLRVFDGWTEQKARDGRRERRPAKNRPKRY